MLGKQLAMLSNRHERNRAAKSIGSAITTWFDHNLGANPWQLPSVSG
jgi:hypothetical protein